MIFYSKSLMTLALFRCVAPAKFNDKVVNSSISIGISIYHQTDNLIKDVVKRADDALYLAKAEGRNRVCYLER